MASESLKDLRQKERLEEEQKLRTACDALAIERYTDKQLKQWSNEHKGLWYLPITDEAGVLLKLAIMKPITRQALSYASTKITEEGLYEFLEAAMRTCWLEGDDCILEEDEFFIPAAQKFNKMMEGYNANLLKR